MFYTTQALMKLYPSIEARVYKSIPPFSAFIIDNWCLLGFFFYKNDAEYSPRIEMDLYESILGDYIQKTFKLLWEDSISIKSI
jgi:hypothetical protein